MFPHLLLSLFWSLFWTNCFFWILFLFENQADLSEGHAMQVFTESLFFNFNLKKCKEILHKHPNALWSNFFKISDVLLMITIRIPFLRFLLLVGRRFFLHNDQNHVEKLSYIFFVLSDEFGFLMRQPFHVLLTLEPSEFHFRKILWISSCLLWSMHKIRPSLTLDYIQNIMPSLQTISIHF